MNASLQISSAGLDRYDDRMLLDIGLARESDGLSASLTCQLRPSKHSSLVGRIANALKLLWLSPGMPARPSLSDSAGDLRLR